MLKVKKVLVLSILVLILIPLVLYFVGIQYVTTDKDEYSAGETVKVKYFSLCLVWKCNYKDGGFFKKEGNTWETFYPGVPNERLCLDGRLNDIVFWEAPECLHKKLWLDSGFRNSDLKLVVRELSGYTNTCEDLRNQTLNERLKNYISWIQVASATDC